MSSPRVLKTIVVPLDAGVESHNAAQALREKKALEEDCRQWERRFERILRLEIAMFDTDDESDMDLMQAADGTCRKYDSIMAKKQQRGEQVKAEMAGLERAGRQMEFNDVEWMRLDSQLKALRRSYLKFAVAFRVALRVRHSVNGHTGGRWGEYRRSSDFKAQRALNNKQKLATVEASMALGLDPIQYAAWKQWRLHYEAEVDGNEADTDATGPTADDQKALADHRLQEKIRKARAGRYQRARPQVVPKQGIDFAASGERGSLHRALVAALDKA